MNLSIKIDNVYEDGEEVTNTLYDVEVERPYGAGQRVEREHGADYYADDEAF